MVTKRVIFLIGVCGLMVLVGYVYADIPHMINYQGVVEVDGVRFDGTGYFKFAIVNAAGDVTYWSNDGTSIAGSEPTDAVSLSVSEGRFSVQLGDTSLPNMTQGIPLNVFDTVETYVRVWFDDGVNGSQQLSPDSRLKSTPYSYKADDAQTLNGQQSSSFITSAGDYGRSGVATNLYEGSQTLTEKYLNAIGPDSISGSSSGSILSATNSGTGYSVYGDATDNGEVENYGGYFVAGGTDGRGVYGEATNSAGGSFQSNYGGYFKSAASSGVGVYGEASSTAQTLQHNFGGYFTAAGGLGTGVYGRATGQEGRGVEGYASHTGEYDLTYGGYFLAVGAQGRGVFGAATNSGDVTNYGGYFRTAGERGRAVFGDATKIGPSVQNYGAYFKAAGGTGRGVYGEATDGGDVENYGGYFTAAGRSGGGVYGEASGIFGQGVSGKATGSAGKGVSGVASGSNGIGVMGEATDTGLGTNYGGWFKASTSYCVGIYALASGASGNGVEGYATGASGTGVVGSGKLYSFYAAGPPGSIDYGTFTGGHDVKLSDDFPADVKPGMLVSVTGKTYVRPAEDGVVCVSSTLPTVKLSDTGNDNAVFGVFVAESSLIKGHWYKANEGERFGTVNALGEGRVWVCNINAPIEVGDYITTSSVPGYGQRQDDSLLRSCTLGKAIETVDWDSVNETVEFNGQTLKVYLIAVVYTSG